MTQCKIAWLLLLVLFAVAPSALQGAELGVMEGEDVSILFDQGLTGGAEEALKIYPEVKGELEKVLRQKVAFAPTVVLIKDTKTFQRMADNPSIVAFAVPERNLMVIDYSKMSIDPFTIELTMKHELCHLLLHQIVKGVMIPKWLDEGIAQWVSAGIPEIIMNQKRSMLNEAVLSGKNLSMRALAGSFPRDRDSLHLAYEASKSLVAYMIKRFGIERVIGILDHLKEGDDWDIAVRRKLNISFQELEEDWHHDLKKRLVWYMYLINNLYELLFFLAAVIAVIAFLRALLKKRASMRDYDDQASGKSKDRL